MNDDPYHRPRIATRIRDLLRDELGEEIDVGLMLGPPEYARAVLNLCRSPCSAELEALGEAFREATEAAVISQRQRGMPAPPGLRA
jgi:hypothetical protein